MEKLEMNEIMDSLYGLNEAIKRRDEVTIIMLFDLVFFAVFWGGDTKGLRPRNAKSFTRLPKLGTTFAFELGLSYYVLSTFLYLIEAKIQAIDPSCLPPKCSEKIIVGKTISI